MTNVLHGFHEWKIVHSNFQERNIENWRRTWQVNWSTTLTIPKFKKTFKTERSQTRKQVTLWCALKIVSGWRMSFLRIRKNSKQQRHCMKTVETDLLPKSTVSLRLLNFQNVFNRRIKNTVNKNFTYQRKIQSMELRFGTSNPRIFSHWSTGNNVVPWIKSKFVSFEYSLKSLHRKATLG